jgi:hypothetical protein
MGSKSSKCLGLLELTLKFHSKQYLFWNMKNPSFQANFVNIICSFCDSNGSVHTLYLIVKYEMII